MYSGGSGLSIDIHFVDIELSYDVLSPLPTLLSKHFNHPHPYIEIATAISDMQSTSDYSPQGAWFAGGERGRTAGPPHTPQPHLVRYTATFTVL